MSQQVEHRMRSLNRVMFLPTIIVSGTVLIVLSSRTATDAVVLAAGAVAAIAAFLLWSNRRILSATTGVCLALAAGVWVYGSWAGLDTSYFGLLVVGSLLVPTLPRARVVWAVVLVVGVALVGAWRVWQVPDESWVLLRFVVLPAGITAAMTALMFPNKRFYDVVRDTVSDLERARDREAELAVARERARFAGDLHDIQGHTLHVVKLKIALARKLLPTDPVRAEEELAEVYGLIGDTIAQTKDLAYARRRLNLTVELENARNLFEAAGIEVSVRRVAGETDPRVDELLGQVLRESTTNILRHARATTVDVCLEPDGLTLVNDGAADKDPELHGLATLRDRVALDGGVLTATVDGGRFTTSVRFTAPARVVGAGP